MTDGTTSFTQSLGPTGLAASVTPFSWRSMLTRRFELVVLVIGVVAAATAVWTTLDARYVEYPGWLAVQKADFILGPICVGLYWRRRRPASRLWQLLILLGFAGILYIAGSSANPTLFGIGVLAETPIYVLTTLVILAFPSGRFDAPSKALIAFLLVPGVLMQLVLNLAAPNLGPGFSISGCHAACPPNGLAIWSSPAWLPQFADVLGVMLAVLPFATVCLLVWRFATGTPPRRRAIAIGGPVAIVFLLMQMSYRILALVAPGGLSPAERPVHDVLQWTVAAARSWVWYGFLLALISAELYAGRVLRRLVDRSVGRPSFHELEGMLRAALGDPGLRLGFWRSDRLEWVNADSSDLAPPRSDQHLTEINRDGRGVIAIIHDEQLVDDPELLRAAGSVALLALENAELDTAWKDSLSALADSRSRLARASDIERQKLERDLHDGAQQRLLAALIRLSAADGLAEEGPAGNMGELQRQLAMSRVELEAAIDELRDLARGIYPSVLAELGLASAFQSVAQRTPERVTVRATKQRFAPELEAAFYYCCLEAVQNALKHAGSGAHTSIWLSATDHELRLEVRDTGPGFDTAAEHDGLGLQSMQDRLAAVGGEVEIGSRMGRGTVVTARAPVESRSALATFSN